MSAVVGDTVVVDNAAHPSIASGSAQSSGASSATATALTASASASASATASVSESSALSAAALPSAASGEEERATVVAQVMAMLARGDVLLALRTVMRRGLQDVPGFDVEQMARALMARGSYRDAARAVRIGKLADRLSVHDVVKAAYAARAFDDVVAIVANGGAMPREAPGAYSVREALRQMFAGGQLGKAVEALARGIVPLRDPEWLEHVDSLIGARRFDLVPRLFRRMNAPTRAAAILAVAKSDERAARVIAARASPAEQDAVELAHLRCAPYRGTDGVELVWVESEHDVAAMVARVSASVRERAERAGVALARDSLACPDEQHVLSRPELLVSACTPVGFDCESAPSWQRGVRNALELLQLYTRGGPVYVVDVPRAAQLPAFGAFVRELVACPLALKLGVGVGDDVRDLMAVVQQQPQPQPQQQQQQQHATDVSADGDVVHSAGAPHTAVAMRACVELRGIFSKEIAAHTTERYACRGHTRVWRGRSLTCNGGRRACSLQGLCVYVLGQHLDKSERMTDWSARPLTPEQLVYAANDAVVAVDLFDAMSGMVQRSRFAAVVAAAARSSAAPAAPQPLRDRRREDSGDGNGDSGDADGDAGGED
jgi:hypothetical protein